MMQFKSKKEHILLHIFNMYNSKSSSQQNLAHKESMEISQIFPLSQSTYQNH